MLIFPTLKTIGVQDAATPSFVIPAERSAEENKIARAESFFALTEIFLYLFISTFID